MTTPFLLCDPALLLPPGADSSHADYQRFWSRLIEWAADRRLRIGPESYAALLDHLGRLGWPDMTPPRCPTALKRDAARALNSLMTMLVTDGVSDRERPAPVFNPAYVRDEKLGPAIARDVATQGQGPMLGAATHPTHWERDVDLVQVVPGPPDRLLLVREPGIAVGAEVDYAVANRLERRRITIVGDRPRQSVCDELCDRFAISYEQIRWIESEPGSEPETDRLKGMNGQRDVVFCVTGKIGHAGRDKTLRIARGCGVRVVCVENASSIASQLRMLFGSP